MQRERRGRKRENQQTQARTKRERNQKKLPQTGEREREAEEKGTKQCQKKHHIIAKEQSFFALFLCVRVCACVLFCRAIVFD
jgi:hypothetical protein